MDGSGFNNRVLLAVLLLSLAVVGSSQGGPVGGPGETSMDPPGGRMNWLVVSPNGPEDGGDFGPKTAGTRTSGLQEALDHAKATGKDVYISGGSWTAGKTKPIVYFLHETLRVPWMQDFRLDSGHCVLQYTGKSGDAVVMDSQMSCYYRFGLIVSNAPGAVVRMKPTSAGPDRFRVITATEFHFNALVGGGGAWPGGEPHQTEVKQDHPWVGTGLMLDGTPGVIHSNKISVIEIVGCAVGLSVIGKSSNNWIEAPFVHLCNTHVQIGGPGQSQVTNNRIEAYMHSEGIQGSVGVRIFGQRNLLTLSTGRMSPGGDVIFEAEARDNLITAIHLNNGITNKAVVPTNRIVRAGATGYGMITPAVPASGKDVMNRAVHPVEVRIVEPGKVSTWRETDARGNSREFSGPMTVGQSFTLAPGDKVTIEYQEAPAWQWKGL